MSRIIAPSILNVDKDSMISAIQEVEKAGAKWIHFDIMDGHFVSASSFTLEETEKYLKATSVFKDVHLMISNPKEMAEKYIEIGAENLTFHYEACADENEVKNIIEIIRNHNVKVGISIKPETPISTLKNVLNLVDMVLLMSVCPGKGGQEFNEHTLSRIKELRKLANECNPKLLIEVDGGIKKKEAEECFKAGADVLVAGTYIFKNDSIEKRFRELNE